MKRLGSALLSFLLIASMAISVCAVSSVPESVMRATESVVRVLAEYSDGYVTGSGFVIKSDKDETLIATNYHVVEGKPYSISVWLSEEETVSATILAYTNQKDVCILKLAYPVSLKPLAFAENGAKQGEAVYAVGFPGAADYLSDTEAHTSADATITDGIVSAVREATVSGYGAPVKILQINAAINSGNSGGPLFNVKGEVVGINTYGIHDSQGIFGAIDVCELKAFLADHSLSVPVSEGGFPWLVLGVAAGAVVCVALIVMLVMRKKKMSVPATTEVKCPLLHEFMAAYPYGIGMNDAVAMLLPVALQLRDLHNNGNAHLQVSPNSIFVGADGAILANALIAESNRYTSGYAAPEIYRGTSAGCLSDIYSFCAVLSYVASGKQPANALSRMDSDVEEHASAQFDGMFAEAIKTGMAVDSASRFASMQDVIIRLSAYNVRPFVNAEAAVDPGTQNAIPVKRAKGSPKAIAVAVAAVLVVALLGTYIGCYVGAKTNAENGDFDAADSLLFAAPVTKLHDAELVAYVDAGQLLTDRKYAEAKSAFEELYGYLNAEEMAQEAYYRHAVQYADANDFANAIRIMEELSETGYKDSADKLLEMNFRNGVYLLQEKNDYVAASYIFTKLIQEGYDGAEEMEKETQYLWAFDLVDKEFYIAAYRKFASIRDYADAKDCLDALSELMYLEGQALYYAEKFVEAEELFNCIAPYADSYKYITLIDAHTAYSWYGSDVLVDRLIDIFYFEDASELLLSGHGIAKAFLLGKWKGDGRYFTMKENGSISYDLPWFDYGDYYKIEDGVILLFPEDKEYSTKPLFSITALSPDCIEVFCHKNNKTYTLFRQ